MGMDCFCIVSRIREMRRDVAKDRKTERKKIGPSKKKISQINKTFARWKYLIIFALEPVRAASMYYISYESSWIESVLFANVVVVALIIILLS